MNATTIICRNKEILHTYLDQEVIMMDVENGNYYHFNPVGSSIWEYLDSGKQSIEALAERIVVDFDIDKETAVSDIIAFVQKTREQGLISIVD